MKKSILPLIPCLLFFQSYSQCSAGEVEVEIVIDTDDYGYEAYWQLIPSGDPCGSASMIAEGGNLNVGCNGGGAQAQDPSGYGNNQTITEGPFCVLANTQLDLIFVDDWGDGGINFEVFINGYQKEYFTGTGAGNTFTFIAAEPPAYDLGIVSSNIYSYVNTGSVDIIASVFNFGTSTVATYDLHYTVNGGTPVTHSVTNSDLQFGPSEQITHSIPANISTNGVYTIKIWADNLDGNSDGDNTNDTLTKITEAGPGTPNYIDGYINQSTNISQIAGSAEQVSDPTDLDFHPVLSNKELWITNRGTENSGGSTVTIFNAGEPTQSEQYKQDGNAWHFMSLPTALAFGENGNWASAPGVFDANHSGSGNPFTGPSLWSSDMSVYAEPSGGNGSHLDMLHQSPYSQGIAAEKDNVYWVVDGFSNDICRYDFVEDHGPGASYHGDAIIRRYADDQITKDPNNTIVSHAILDESKQWLYVVDHGGQRVIRVDINTGSMSGSNPSFAMTETVEEYSVYSGYTQETVVTGLDKPAGIDIIDDRMIVSEYQTGEIIIYDVSSMPATELYRIQTGYSSVQGIKIGPEGRIWFVDGNSNGVYKIDVQGLNLEENQISLNVYPNPSNGIINITASEHMNGTITVYDVAGKLVYSEQLNALSAQLYIDAPSGIYTLIYRGDNEELFRDKLIID